MIKTIRCSFVMGLVLFAFNIRGAPLDMTADALSTLTSQVENLTLTIGISPMATNSGLRSITLYVNKRTRFEPAIWPDGTPVTAYALITSKEAIQTICLVSEAGLFKQSTKSYSERTPVTTNTPSPPANAKDMRLSNKDKKLSIVGKSISLRYVTCDPHWYSYYNMLIPWNCQSKELMSKISEVLSGEGRRLIESLILQMNDVQSDGSGGLPSPQP